ncbi:GNAT family N-acetyltransferase [Streptomyces sp. NPDC093225]|uniref:GNAT family N-acetyltransferase n=1 Tax=Streptomyces sp. NPDC093225 TaxID=3366034 RepID=UPI0037F3A1C8
MTWTFGEDLAAFTAAAGATVEARPVENTLMLSCVDALRRRGPNAFGAEAPLYGWWTAADGAVTAAALCTRPRPMLLTALPAASVRPLAAALAAEPRLAGVTGFNAERSDAEALAGARGRPSRVTEEQRLYRLAGLVPPDPAPAGVPRIAGEADVPLVLDWVNAFVAELEDLAPADEGWVRDRIGYGGVVLWEHDGTPVSLACRTRPLGGASRVGPVYTPPEHRGRGYAAGATAEASRLAGTPEVLLFTDLANPTSNGIYRRIGYVPVTDRVVVTI